MQTSKEQLHTRFCFNFIPIALLATNNDKLAKQVCLLPGARALLLKGDKFCPEKKLRFQVS